MSRVLTQRKRIPYLFLLVIDGHFQPLKLHMISVLIGGTLRVIIEYYGQLLR